MAVLGIGTNVAALVAQRRLGETTDSLGKIYERLSSGQRINRASDDAAGLAISAALKADGRVYAQAIRNVNDGLSALNVAQGALEQLSTIAIRQKELAAQAANGSYRLEQRRALNAEANALVDEYNRIVRSTTFNGLPLLDGGIGTLSLQAGRDTINIEVANLLGRTVGDGTFSAAGTISTGTNPWATAITDIDRDGTPDLLIAGVFGTFVMLGNGNGTFDAGRSFSGGIASKEFGLLDFNGDNLVDLAVNASNSMAISLGNGNGTFTASRSYATPTPPTSVQAGDLNGDGAYDLVAANWSIGGVSLLLGNGNGTFRAQSQLDGAVRTYDVVLNDFNGDGRLDLAKADMLANQVGVLLGDGQGGFSDRLSFATNLGPISLTSADLNGDGLFDLATTDYNNATISILFGNGDGTFHRYTTARIGAAPHDVIAADITGDGRLDLIASDQTGNSMSVLIGNGNGTFSARRSYPVTMPKTLGVGDINQDGVLDVIGPEYSSASAKIFLGNTLIVSTIAYLNINSAAGAQAAIGTIDATLERLQQQLGALGAAQSRLQIALNVLGVMRETYSAAESRITDADIAGDAARLLHKQILQQTSSALLAQASQQPALALRLLT